MGRFLRPSDLASALRLLADGPSTVLAGGTDVYPAHADRPLTGDVIDISRVGGLRGIAALPGFWRIGATTTWTDIAAAALPPGFAALQQAAREVGGQQIQNAGTIGGNLCNASPAADGVPPLLALDAAVEVASIRGTRIVPLADFIAGPRRTVLRPGELLTALRVPAAPGERAAARFLKLGSRRYLVISFAMVAAHLAADAAGRIVAAAIAVGACSPVARRLPALEAALLGQPVSANLAAVAAPDHLAVLDPIDDVRADRAYRLESAWILASRAIALAQEALR
jgi:CO/xanthine dehydrogenase FAD-binding subunit